MGAPVPVAIVAALLSGLAAGLFNGFWIAYVGLPSLAVTLAGLIGYRGIARILVEDRAIGGFPLWFNTLGQQPLLGPLTVSIVDLRRCCSWSSRSCCTARRSAGSST